MLPRLSVGEWGSGGDGGGCRKVGISTQALHGRHSRQAMIGIARIVSDPKIKDLLRASDGMGTPVTQAAIIQPSMSACLSRGRAATSFRRPSDEPLVDPPAEAPQDAQDLCSGRWAETAVWS